ncbi:tRNA (adenosine(37)-N6)-dimethylallyltransferase MiaA [Rhodalgimonas zhirmunskyi]|uniref:tRNA dimethylallyltransferase n=1 Tax=Rhodalgimonas zhirmunskyi TaxID=2964767 RepID=A0AAJ1U3J9_9RHOB|nr:tRNA (adenosine(37)-N6)-dimethylallyltransferase MiaA [Rhodoalgimonas zhirmunskyi]MDQ2092585.1 tRNA (adenosine(37)-N6)-dimethylallyltransferase MiaA [Rhodoalgimonas zhirmunskyi]
MTLLDDIDPQKPVLIAGPTACGKSALALMIAEAQGGTIVNADALQVFANWRVLTARPSAADEARAPHALYGHVPGDQAYSVGHWLREVAPLLTSTRPIITGGTGLYFSALTEGLAEIPPIPPEVRQDSSTLTREEMLAQIAPGTAARIDQLNPMRVQRAWEVERATGKPLHLWQDDTPPPLLPLADATALVFDAPKEWLTPRIEARFDQMLAQGALDEARANAPHWDPAAPSSKAIGAAELIAHVTGEIPLSTARTRAIIATRQYAKRQRSWFRARMSAPSDGSTHGWRQIPAG